MVHARVALALALALICGMLSRGWAQAELPVSALDVSGGAASAASATTWVDAEYIPDHVLASTDSYVLSASEQAALDAEARDEFMLLDDATKGMHKNTLGGVSTMTVAATVAAPAASSLGASMLQVGSSAVIGQRRGFLRRVKAFAGKVSAKVKRVSERVRGFVTKVQTGIHKFKDKVSNFVGNVVNKAQAFGEKLGGSLGAKISEIAGKVNDKYNEISGKVMSTVDNVAGKLNGKIDEYSTKATNWLDKFSGQQKSEIKNFEQQTQTKQFQFQTQQNQNLQYLANVMNKNNGVLWDGIKQLREQAGGFREGGLLPKSYLVAQKNGTSIMVGSVQGGITPLVKYTGAPQAAGIYVAKDGTAYTANGVILPRHSGPNGPQAYVGPNGVVYNAGQYPSNFFYGAKFPGGQNVVRQQQQRSGNMFRGLVNKLGNKAIDFGQKTLAKWKNKIAGKRRAGSAFNRLKIKGINAGQSALDKWRAKLNAGQAGVGGVLKNTPTTTPKFNWTNATPKIPNFDEEYTKTNGEGWTTSIDPKDGLKTAVREKVNTKEERSSSSSTTINTSTKGLFGGAYDQIVGGYAESTVSDMFDEGQAKGDKLIDDSEETDRDRIRSSVYRGSMASDRYAL